MYTTITPPSQQPKISVIVAVFNVERYICRCIDSLLLQTFSDFEIILVDDGSTDKSGVICDEYVLKDRRIHVIHKENGGVASARQAGTDVAIGEYIIHADPDDWVDPTMLEELYSKAKDSCADVTICDYYLSDGTECRYVCQEPPKLDAESVLCALFHRLHGSLWNKLVRRACYIKYHLRFIPGINYCEDVLIWVQLLQNPDIKVAYLNKAYYYYYQGNSESITHSLTPQMVLTTYMYHEALDKLMPQKFHYLVERTKMRFDFVLWKNNLIDGEELSSRGYKINDIVKIDYGFGDRLIYALATRRCHKVAKLLLSFQRIFRKLKSLIRRIYETTTYYHANGR